MAQYIDKDALVAKIEQFINKANYSDTYNHVFRDGNDYASKRIIHLINTLEAKEVDLELITYWFDHIAQIADDRKTANGTVMEDWAALDEIKCLAKNSSEFIKMHYKAQKGE